MSAAITAMIAQRNRIIRRFKQAGATSAPNAIDPATQQVHSGMLFNRLVQDGILVKVRAHQYYLDEKRAADLKEERIGRVGMILIILIIAVVVYLFVRWLS